MTKTAIDSLHFDPERIANLREKLHELNDKKQKDNDVLNTSISLGVIDGYEYRVVVVLDKDGHYQMALKDNLRRFIDLGIFRHSIEESLSELHNWSIMDGIAQMFDDEFKKSVEDFYDSIPQPKEPDYVENDKKLAKHLAEALNKIGHVKAQIDSDDPTNVSIWHYIYNSNNDNYDDYLAETVYVTDGKIGLIEADDSVGSVYDEHFMVSMPMSDQTFVREYMQILKVIENK